MIQTGSLLSIPAEDTDDSRYECLGHESFLVHGATLTIVCCICSTLLNVVIGARFTYLLITGSEHLNSRREQEMCDDLSLE
jgi:hypothetical protein